MQPWIKPDEVRRRIPAGCKLPARFDAFLQAEERFRIEWNNLDAYSLKPSATEQAVPFLRLSDGGLIALWYHQPSPAVVHIGGHGELQVLARSFVDFLKALNARCIGLSDFDDAEPPVRVSGVSGPPNRDGLDALQAQFDEWFQAHTSLLEPLVSPETEALRLRVFRIAQDMIRGGRSKVYTLASPWWSMDFRIERAGANLAIQYRDYGEWYSVPEESGLSHEVSALLQLVQDKTRHHYDLEVNCAGIVSIDRDRQLLLVAPNAAT